MNSVESYFNLKTQNEDLANENARLKMLLFNKKDTTIAPVVEDIKGINKNNVILAKVIHNSYNVHENYITIDSGDNKGVKQDMGVINDLGIVGIVENTSENYATVQSILNTNSQINAKLKKGDTIVTGGQSVIFPENINIGTIDRVFIDNQTNYYTLQVRLFNDMTNLGHVYIIKSKDREEIKKLEDKTKKSE